MTTQMTPEFAADLLKDELGQDQATRLLAALTEILETEDCAQVIGEVLSLGAAGTRTIDLSSPSLLGGNCDVLLFFSTQACTVQFASGGTSVPVAAGGVLMLHTASLAYFKITMGATAGTVATFLAK